MHEHITSYKLVQKPTADELEMLVQELINHGYEPNGAPFTLQLGNGYMFYQALIKRELV